MNIIISLEGTKRGYYITYIAGEYRVIEVLDITDTKSGVRFLGGYSKLSYAMADITISIEHLRSKGDYI